MSRGELGWESLLSFDAPSGAMLKAALLTTYDRPDEQLLVEHLLPMLLKLEHTPQGDGREGQYFLLELDARLKQLHGRMTVVSSTVRDEPCGDKNDESAAYPWIWRSIRHLTVGSRGKAVQHAKLWLLHWSAAEDGGGERLEIVVSSANLTRAAFRGQIQVAWRACLDLHPQPARARLAGWGVLPKFLDALAVSTGNAANLDTYLGLLARAECPKNATFLASVPGTHSARDLRRTPWGTAGLRGIAPPGRGAVNASILSPYVGMWNTQSLQRWCANFDGAPDRLRLIWIDRRHPWTNAWLLPATTLQALTDTGATVLHMRHVPDDGSNTDRFHAKHRAADPRWSHAKLYVLRRGNSRRLLLTSANFSQAAWGRAEANGGINIANFELGICIEQADWPFDELAPFADAREIATTAEPQNRFAATILWAAATWNGKAVDITCCCANIAALTGKLRCGDIYVPVEKWRRSNDGDGRYRARLPWSDIERQPASVLLACGEETIRIAIFDTRPFPEREASIPDGVDTDSIQTLRDALLFEQYGGRVADDMDAGGDAVSESFADVASAEDLDEAMAPAANGNRDSYAVAAFVLARQYLRIVDNWVARMSHAVTGCSRTFERQIVRHDGELLIEAFHRQVERDGVHDEAHALGSRLAAEELKIRLRHFAEDA